MRSSRCMVGQDLPLITVCDIIRPPALTADQIEGQIEAIGNLGFVQVVRGMKVKILKMHYSQVTCHKHKVPRYPMTQTSLIGPTAVPGTSMALGWISLAPPCSIQAPSLPARAYLTKPYWCGTRCPSSLFLTPKS